MEGLASSVQSYLFILQREEVWEKAQFVEFISRPEVNPHLLELK